MITRFLASVLSARFMTRMNDSHAVVHLVVDFVLVLLLDLVLSCPVPEVGSALDVLLHVLIPAVGYALLFLLHVFALLLGMLFSYPLWVRSFQPFVQACLLELYSLSSVAACECVGLAPRAPYSTPSSQCGALVRQGLAMSRRAVRPSTC